ncbi:MAG: transposase [Acidimicrobiia bacterium]|nr:transposase [Acidimicrobiia bacterium]
MDSEPVSLAQTWRTAHGDMTDGEWELFADLVALYWKPGRMGRPVKVDRRRIVDAIFYVAGTGCHWRALPGCYPNWNAVHRYHLTWSRDGTWARIAARLAELSVPTRAPTPSRQLGSWMLAVSVPQPRSPTTPRVAGSTRPAVVCGLGFCVWGW